MGARQGLAPGLRRRCDGGGRGGLRAGQRRCRSSGGGRVDRAHGQLCRTRRNDGRVLRASRGQGQPAGAALARHCRAARSEAADGAAAGGRRLRRVRRQSLLPRCRRRAVRRLCCLRSRRRVPDGPPVARQARCPGNPGRCPRGDRLARHAGRGRHRPRHRHAGLLHGRTFHRVEHCGGRTHARGGQFPRRRAGARRCGQSAPDAAR